MAITPMTIVDDDGSGTTGTVWNAAFQLAFEANINAVIGGSIPGIGVVSTDAYVLQNPTLSTAVISVQQSPRLRFRSNVWNTTAVAANNTDDWWIESVPVSGTVPSGLLQFRSSLNGAGATSPMTLSSAGVLSLPTAGHYGFAGVLNGMDFTTTSTFVRPSDGGGYFWVDPQAVAINAAVLTLGSGLVRHVVFGIPSGTGLGTLLKGDQSAGIGFDLNADAVFKLRTRAQTGYATFDGLGYRINGGAGAVGSVDTIQKSIAAIANAVATSVLTITIPNAAHSATIMVTVAGAIGAGGTIGADEASASNSYVVTVTRTPGVNAVATVSAAYGAAAAAVAGATTVTATLAAAAVSGAVGAVNTIALQITITRGGGASTNHTCQLVASTLNANATGITIA